MRQGSFSGFHFVTSEDFAVSESQGHRADRQGEYLNAGDRAVVRLRGMLLNAVKQFQTGKIPTIARHEDIPYPQIRVTGDIVPGDFDWRAW